MTAVTATAKGNKSTMVLLFKEISESPKTRTHVWTQGPQKDSADVIELHSPEGCQTWGSSNGLFCTKGDSCFSQERWGRELSNRECFQRNPPSQLCSHLGSSGEWLGWAAEMGQWQSVHNNRVWVILGLFDQTYPAYSVLILKQSLEWSCE